MHIWDNILFSCWPEAVCSAGGAVVLADCVTGSAKFGPGGRAAATGVAAG